MVIPVQKMIRLVLLCVMCVGLARSSSSTATTGISLWLDAQQVDRLLGTPAEIYVIRNGTQSLYLQDITHEQDIQTLPIVRASVTSLTLNWEAENTYQYTFLHLLSSDTSVMGHPVLSIPLSGEVPHKQTGFNVRFPCTGDVEDYAVVSMAMSIFDEKLGEEIKASPLSVKFRKQCAKVTRPSCQCENGGFCDDHGICNCPDGFFGPMCKQAICNPRCFNGGRCIAPEMCLCVDGFTGRSCEQALCTYSCGPHGRCVAPETCECHKHWSGQYCEKKLLDVLRGVFHRHGKHTSKHRDMNRTKKLRPIHYG